MDLQENKEEERKDDFGKVPKGRGFVKVPVGLCHWTDQKLSSHCGLKGVARFKMVMAFKKIRSCQTRTNCKHPYVVSFYFQLIGSQASLERVRVMLWPSP